MNITTTSRKNITQALREQVYRREKMRQMCRDYIRRPIAMMTEGETADLADAMSLNAASCLRIRDPKRTYGQRRITQNERIQYRNAIYASINYFNSRDKEHLQHMRYLSECRAARELSEQQQKDVEKKKSDIVVHII